MKIQFTKHAYLKLKEREIEKEEVKQVMEHPKEEILLDTETGNIVIVGDRSLKIGHKLLVVLSEDMQKVVTLIDTSKIDIINRKKEKGRWIKIK
jgi:SOS response regulatory protein OraA/RecX